MAKLVAKGLIQRRSGIQVITRAMAVMRTVRDCSQGISLSGIAGSIDLPRSTVQRIVKTLADEGMLMPTERNDGWVLGPEATSLGDQRESEFVTLCRPILMQISATTGETADLSVFKSTYMFFLDQCIGSHRLRAIGKIGDAFPLTTTANGRAVLSLLPDEQVKEIARLEFKRYGRRSDMGKFMRLVEEVRNSGLAYDLDEHTKGISAVGIPIADRHNVPHAISVPLPSARFGEARKSIEKVLLAAGKEIKLLLTSRNNKNGLGS